MTKRNPLNPKPIVARTKTMLDLVRAHPQQVIRAFKVVGPTMGPHCRRNTIGLTCEGTFDKLSAYHVGGVFKEPDADRRVSADCGKGLNVGTYEWCIYVCTADTSAVKPDRDLLMEVEFTRKDVAAFPLDGRSRYTKFRVFRFKVVSCRIFTPREAEQIRYMRHYNMTRLDRVQNDTSTALSRHKSVVL